MRVQLRKSTYPADVVSETDVNAEHLSCYVILSDGTEIRLHEDRRNPNGLEVRCDEGVLILRPNNSSNINVKVDLEE